MTEHREPIRLREDDALRSLLDSASLDDDAAAVERIGARLGLSSLQAATGATPPPQPPLPADGATSAAVSGLWKIGAVIAVVAGVGALAALQVASTEERPSTGAITSVPTPPVRQTTSDDPPRAELDDGNARHPDTRSETTELAPPPAVLERLEVREPDEARVTTARRRAEPRPVAPLAPDAIEEGSERGTLAAEIRLVEQIRAAVATDAQLALRLAEQHQAEFPDGHLRTERERLQERARAIAAH